MKVLTVAEKIRVQRLSRNFSQENMAAELGISVGAYSNLERGKTEIAISRLYKIAEILKADINVFLTNGDPVGEDSPPYITQKQLHTVASRLKDYEEQIQRQRVEINYLKEIIELLKKGQQRRKKK